MPENVLRLYLNRDGDYPLFLYSRLYLESVFAVELDSRDLKMSDSHLDEGAI